VNAAPPPPPPAPTVTLSVDPTSIALGQSAMLTWSSTNATSCTASGAWSGTQKTSGTLQVTPSSAGTSAYMLSCSGADNGASGTSVAKLTVSAPMAAVTGLSGKAGGGGMGLWSLLGLGLLVACRMRRALRPTGFGTLAVFAVFMVLGAGAPASAQETAAVQFKWDQTYVGIRVGSGSYWESSRQLDADLAANDETGTSTSVDQHRASGVVYAGVPFYRALSLELGFADLGTYPVKISTTSTDIAQLAQTIARNLSPAGRAVTLNLAAPIDINPWFALDPRIGVFGYHSKQEVFTPIGTFSHDREGAGVDAGLALLLRPTRSAYIGAGIDCFDTAGRCNVLLYSAQIEYHFGR
jgi:OmpA-like transmembrane domain